MGVGSVVTKLAADGYRLVDGLMRSQQTQRVFDDATHCAGELVTLQLVVNLLHVHFQHDSRDQLLWALGAVNRVFDTLHMLILPMAVDSIFVLPCFAILGAIDECTSKPGLLGVFIVDFNHQIRWRWHSISTDCCCFAFHFGKMRVKVVIGSEGILAVGTRLVNLALPHFGIRVLVHWEGIMPCQATVLFNCIIFFWKFLASMLMNKQVILKESC